VVTLKIKSCKCCHNDCPNEAEGYYVGGNYGLWLCKKHVRGTKTTDIKEARGNPEKAYLHDIEVEE